MKLENILKASICAFCENTFDNYSLEEEEFIEALDYYINDNNYEERLQEYAYKIDYDFENIINIANESKYKNKNWDYINIMNCCRIAYINTITNDKTINAEAFVDNVIKELNKNQK